MDDSKSQMEAWRAHLYSQVPLRTKSGDIRLLTIQPRAYSKSTGHDNDGLIHCFLKLSNFKKQQTQYSKFTTISHACNTDGRATILINGAVVPTSQDLFDVLVYLQKEDEPVVVWIDAFCINQTDCIELSAQKSQLESIFSAASSAVIWLGSAVDNSDEAMIALRRLANEHLTPAAQKFLLNAMHLLPLVAKSSEPTKFNSDTSPRMSVEGQGNLDDQLHQLRVSFQSLMSRKYWSRLWSLQELVFISKGAVVCGHETLDLDRFFQSAKALDGVLNMATYSKWLAASRSPVSSPSVLETIEPANFSTSPAIRLLLEREFFREGRGWWSSTEHPLLSILSRYCLDTTGSRPEFQVTDRRDLVFGFLGLASDAIELGLPIDYGKTYEQICMDTTVALSKKDSRALQLCLGHHDAGSEVSSWIIDWSKVKIPPSHLGKTSFKACGPADSRYYRFDSTESGIASLRGVFVDTISDIRIAKEDNSTDHTKNISIAVNEYLERSLENSESPYSKLQVQDLPINMVKGSAFITKYGYVGCGSNVADDDLIAILYGLDVPVSLRKQPDGTYRMVGEVYVIGIMEGEFMKTHRDESTIRVS